MTTSRRTMLLATATTTLAAVACGGGDDDPQGSGGTSAQGGNPSSSSGTGASSSDGGGPTGGGNGGNGGVAGGGLGGGGGQGGSTMSTCGTAIVVRGSNYGVDPHEFTIPVADIIAGETKTYPTTGESHTHDVTVTAEDFAALQNGETVRLYMCFTSDSFIDHEWPISCVDANVMPLMEGDIGTENNCPS